MEQGLGWCQQINHLERMKLGRVMELVLPFLLCCLLASYPIVDMKTCLDRFSGILRCGCFCRAGLLLLLVACIAGCGSDDAATKAETETDPAAASSDHGSGNPLTAPVDYLGAVNQAQKSSANKLSLMGIQQAIQQFKIMEDRLPKNLKEVVSSGYISRLPEVPRGMAISYNPQTGVVSTTQAPVEEAGK